MTRIIIVGFIYVFTQGESEDIFPLKAGSAHARDRNNTLEAIQNHQLPAICRNITAFTRKLFLRSYVTSKKIAKFYLFSVMLNEQV